MTPAVTTAAATIAAATPSDSAGTDPVGSALHELVQAQSALVSGTWRQGNIPAGIAAIGPQVLIATAQASLQTWHDSIGGAQNFFAGTEGIPIVHGIARVALAAIELLPSIAQASMGAAQQVLPAVSLFGAQDAALGAYANLSEAQRNGLVYAVIPTAQQGTKVIVYISVNGGAPARVLLDTGSKGLIISPDNVGQQNLGPSDDSTCSDQSGGHCVASYGFAGGGASTTFDAYTTSVDFGNGIITDPTPVGIVTSGDAAAFAASLPEGVVGILGVGPNSRGPLTSSVTSALPGLLSTGMLLDERAGYLVLGGNPLPARAKLDGNPHTPIVLTFNGGHSEAVSTGSFDTGGDYGGLSSSLWPTEGLPSGTVISVYTADGETLLYSYTVNATNAPTEVSNASRPDYFNTGVEAFLSGPVYVDFSANDGNGATHYDYHWW